MESRSNSNDNANIQQEIPKSVKESNLNENNPSKKPTICIVIGMAGSGKTTLMQVFMFLFPVDFELQNSSFFQNKFQEQRLTSHLFTNKTPTYVVNLDPAVLSVPFGCNIDIRDTVKYKEIMKE